MAPKPSCLSLPPWLGGVTDSGAKGILKAPRVLLVVIFPTISFILYLLLSLGCINNGLSSISPIVISSNAALSIGGTVTRLDMRIGFWGICFGPSPYSCASSLTIIPTKSVADLMGVIPATKGGSNMQLVKLALGLQASLIVFSGIILLVILGADLLANAIEIYFNVVGLREEHVRAAVWARALDWAAAAGSIVAFGTYRSLVDNTGILLQTVTGTSLTVAPGTVASGMFAAVVGISVAGAVINTILTSGDAGSYAYRTAKAAEDSARLAADPGFDKFKDDMRRRRAAYEAFP
ncbi:hypothetical protein QBC47DRAFT_309430 [Echria macrotheca]|uniref:Uncharacterized protein n=1 Tax=Echria macrotheca TaxID=438768 RepID=A0AAJ0B7A4_9PEZI|nr:hypothetical protein QBC47DRAFT_309430 [Echria macrotheca]